MGRNVELGGESKSSLEYSNDLTATNVAVVETETDNMRELPVGQQDDALPKLQSSGGLEQQTDLDRILSELPNGFATFDREWRYTYANNRLLSIFRLSRAEVLGKKAWEVFPHQVGIENFDLLNRAMTDRVEAQFEFYYDLAECWVEHRVYPTADGLAILMADITERKQAEKISQLAAKFDAFRLTLADALRSIADPVEIQAVASCVLGEHLDANRVLYFEVRGDNYFAEHNYVNGVIPLVGSYSIDSFGAKLLATYRSGRAAIESNVAADLSLSPAERAAYTAAQIGAYIAIPLIKNGEFVAGLAVDSAAPRNWTPEEVALVEEVAERTWAALERARAEAALRESEARYRTLFESIDEGYVLMDTIFDADDRLIDLHYLQTNPAAVRMMGLDPVGRRASEVFEIEPHWMAAIDRAAKTGIGERHELYTAQADTWYSFYVFKIGDAQSRRVAMIYEDITDRKRREANLGFLTEIQDEFTRLVSAAEIMQTVGEKIGAYLNVSNCLFVDIDAAHDRTFVEYHWHTADALDLVGVYRLSDFVNEEFRQAAQARETIVINDTQVDPLTADNYAAINIHTAVSVPFHRGGEWKYLLIINDSRSRDWREDEIELVSELANRIFPRLERARAEAALCRSEAKYRNLFESMDEGYVLMDLIFDAEDRPVDLYYLEANPAAVDAIGTNPVGLKASDIYTVESHWLEILGRVAQTGIGERHELRYAALDNWHSFYVFKIGDADRRQVAFIYEDITDRKRREANLAFLTEIQDEFAGLVSADEIMQAVGEKIGAYLNVAHCLFTDIYEEQDKVVVEYDWHNSETQSLVGVYRLSEFANEEFLQAARAKEAIVVCNTQTDARTDADGYAALNIQTFVTVPCHRGNEWKYSFSIMDSRSREWREDEIELVSELADRIFPRLERARAEAEVAANLRNTQLLRDLSVRLIAEDNTQTLYREILATAIDLTHADAGTVRILDDRSQDLLLISSQGFDRQMNEDFYRVNISSPTSYGIAMRNGERAVVDFDVPESEDPDGSMRRHLEAGYLSAQSTPLFSRTGKLLGMISTQWRSRYRPIDSPKERLCQRDLRALDLLARQAADLIEQQQTTATLREREEQLRLASEAAKVGMWFWNLETDSLIWTERCKALFGLAAETEMSYTVFIAAIHPDDRQRTDAAVTRSIEERTDYDIEYRCCWPDGSVHWIAAKGSCAYDPAGQPVRMMGVAIDIDAIEQSKAALRHSEEQLAIELADTQQLQHISSQLICEDNIRALYQQILDAAIALMGADMGSVQMLDPDTNELRLLAWQGFDPASAEFWSVVRVDSDSSCGAALDSRERTIVPDIETCDFMAGTDDLNYYRLSGIRAVQSTPLISRHGRLVGMISTHWCEPHQPSARRLRLLDVLARQVADLLDRKQIEEALQRSEEQSRSILESITDAFIALDENWQYTYVNSTAEELLFRPPGYLVGKNIWSEYPGLLDSEFERLYRRVAAEGVADAMVAFYPDHNRWYEVRVYPVAKGITVYCSNVTGRKQTELALRESQERLSLVQLAAKIGAWDWDVTTGTVYWSPEYYTLYGTDLSVPPSYDSWLASIFDVDRDTTKRAMQEAFEQQQTYFNFEFRTAHPVQGIRWIGARGQIFYDPDRQPQRVTGIAIDVTERKQAEIALAERNQELDSFVYIVSHDLKAPLRAISNLSVWIEEDFGKELPANTQQQMAQLRGRVQRMEGMIDGLLNYARIGRTDAQIELVSVAELLEEILDSLAPPSTFEIFVAPDLPTFHTKRLLLSQVFTNLIGNAFKHHGKSSGFIRISCQDRGDFYEFAVADDGPGIAADQRDRVFVIFQAANPQKNPDSTGIGLSIVKKIIETVGGQIRLESELGKGTAFYFTWPK
jgi:PAS domain S-box-containing protein